MSRKSLWRRFLCHIGQHRLGRDRHKRLRFHSEAESRKWQRLQWKGGPYSSWGYFFHQDGKPMVDFRWWRCIFCGAKTCPDSTVDDLIDALIDELNSRGGFDHWWDSLDEDIQSEIREALATRARDYIRVHGGPG